MEPALLQLLKDVEGLLLTIFDSNSTRAYLLAVICRPSMYT